MKLILELCLLCRNRSLAGRIPLMVSFLIYLALFVFIQNVFVDFFLKL